MHARAEYSGTLSLNIDFLFMLNVKAKELGAVAFPGKESGGGVGRMQVMSTATV